MADRSDAGGPPPGDGAPWPVGERVVLHVDMDAFFASVEVLDDPSLAGRPVIVGGSGPRGVVAACTYEARRFGVHSAMASSVARRCCPGAVFVDGRYHRYVEESRRLHAILDDLTPLVEGISLDEAFLDVTGTLHRHGTGRSLAVGLRRRVTEELRLDCSVGVGRSKLIAKLASKAAKPRADRAGITPGPGVVVVRPDEEEAFLRPMPIRALWGIGPATERRLHALGITTVGGLADQPEEVLVRALGRSAGRHLGELARGVDERPVVREQAAKSIGHEETFATDLWDPDTLRRHLLRMVDASTTHLRGAGLAARTVTVKLRLADFRLLTRSRTLPVPVDAPSAVARVATELFDSVELDLGVRLLGVSLSGFGDQAGGAQLAFDLGGPGDATGVTVADDAVRLQDSWGTVTGAVDAIRARYGGDAVGPAALLEGEGLALRRRGVGQWGPSASADEGDRAGESL